MDLKNLPSIDSLGPFLSWFVPLIISLPIVSVVFLLTRFRPHTLWMRAIALFSAGLGIAVGLILTFVVELSFSGRGAESSRWGYLLSVLTSTLAFAPLTYSMFIIVDTLRLMVRRVFPDRPNWAHLTYWHGPNLTLALVGFPVLIFTAATLLTTLLGLYPVYSAIAVDVIRGEMRLSPDMYQFSHPRIFHVGETAKMTVEATGDTHTRMSCTLEAPGFDTKLIPTPPQTTQFRSGGAGASEPDCLWLVTAKQTGNQQVVLHLVAVADDTRSIHGYNVMVQNPDITDIETLTVSSPLFTFPNLVAFVGLVSAIVGLLRSAKTGSTEKQPAIDSGAKG